MVWGPRRFSVGSMNATNSDFFCNVARFVWTKLPRRALLFGKHCESLRRVCRSAQSVCEVDGHGISENDAGLAHKLRLCSMVEERQLAARIDHADATISFAAVAGPSVVDYGASVRMQSVCLRLLALRMRLVQRANVPVLRARMTGSASAAVETLLDACASTVELVAAFDLEVR